MSLKASLIDELHHLARDDRQGSFKTRQVYQSQMLKIINDLIRLKIAPEHISTLRHRHIESLILHWREQQLSDATIANKLSVIKRYCRLSGNTLAFDRTRELGVERQGVKDSGVKIISLNQLEDICHPLVKTIVSFEVNFGLTKFESIRINLNQAMQQSDLVISRALSYNDKERFIPIIYKAQKEAIAERKRLLNIKSTLSEILDERVLSAMYDGELEYLGIKSQNLRIAYASVRIQSLKTSFANNYSKIKKTLRSELGYANNYNLSKALNL